MTKEIQANKFIEAVRRDPKALLRMKEVAADLTSLHSMFEPHSGQVRAGSRMFYPPYVKFLFLQCGRNWGKSYFGVYTGVRQGIIYPNTKNYIVYPERAQALEVIWESGYLQEIIPAHLLCEKEDKAWNKTELRVRFRNGSFLKLVGSDNPNSLRGIKPHFVIYDEFRDFKTDVYDIMEPNLGANDAILLILSTPPDREGTYTELRKFFLDEIAAGNKDYFYLELPTSTNPHYPKHRLDTTKRALIARGEYSKWLREYMAQFIPGGASGIFPMFGRRKRKIVKAPGTITKLMEKDRSRMHWYCIFDPAANSTFAVLLVAVHPYTGQCYFLNEIYEKDRMATGSKNMWLVSKELKKKYWPIMSDWINVYDEHEAWFCNDLDREEILDPGEVLISTQKASRSKDEDIALIKDLFLADNILFISEKCHFLIFELENYVTDKTGKPLKKDDHLIDCFRYFLAASDFTPEATPDPNIIIDEDTGLVRRKSFDEVIAEHRAELDWTEDIDEAEYFDDEIDFINNEYLN